eukprot:tig00020807_g14064.t1
MVPTSMEGLRIPTFSSASNSRCETPIALESDSENCSFSRSISLHNKPTASPLARLFKALNTVAHAHSEALASPPLSPRSEPEEPSPAAVQVRVRDSADATAHAKSANQGIAQHAYAGAARRRKSIGADAQAPASTGDLRVSLAKRNLQRRSSMPSALAPPGPADSGMHGRISLPAKRTAEAEAPPAASLVPVAALEIPLRAPHDRDARAVYWTSDPACYAYSQRYKRRASLGCLRGPC